PGSAILVTVKDADPAALAGARAALGPDHVWTIGHGVVDLEQVVARLTAEGWTKVLCEGGPRLHTELLRRDLVDQLALTWVPHLIAGQAPRIAHGPNLTVNITLKHLIESAGTLLTLWERRGPVASG
ncbi:MAG: dihydrofolate reductase family protein, partial [Nostocoides sp.]